MTVSSDTTRLAMVRETTPGVTPANPAFLVARFTSEGLNFNPTTQLSNELNPSRQVTDVVVSGGSSGGDVAFELSRNPWFEEMLSAVLANEWDATLPGRLEVGSIIKTYSIEKRFTVDAAALPDALYDHHRIVRSVVDSMQLTFTPGGPNTGSVTILGSTYTRSDDAIVGATYNGPNTTPVMVGADAFPITISIGGTDYDAWCFTNITVNFRNNGRAIECLGQAGAAATVIGRFECEITTQIYVEDATSELMDAFLNREEIGFAFVSNDSLDNAYAFDFPRVRVAAAQQVAGGTNTDVILNATLQALVTLTGDDPAVQSTVIITRNPAGPAAREAHGKSAATEYRPTVFEYPEVFEAERPDVSPMRETASAPPQPTPEEVTTDV
jgi:hypothetical protein